MAKRKYVSKSRKFRKKTAYRKKRTTTRYKKKSAPLAGLQQTQLVKFRYCTNVVLNPAGGNLVTTTQYRAASIYDPEYTSIGSSVQNYTQYATNYGHYMVIGSKITVRSLNSQATSSIPCMWGIVLSRTVNAVNPATTVGLDILQSAGSAGGNNKFRTQGGIGGFNSSMTRKFSARRFYGIAKKDSVFTYQTLHSLFGANPVEEPTFTLWASNVVSLADPDPQVFHVQLDYIAKVWEPRTIYTV